MSWRPHLSYNGFISWAHQSIAQSIMLLYSWSCHVSHSVQILIVGRGKVRHSEDRGHRGLSRKQFHFLQLSLSLSSQQTTSSHWFTSTCPLTAARLISYLWLHSQLSSYHRCASQPSDNCEMSLREAINHGTVAAEWPRRGIQRHTWAKTINIHWGRMVSDLERTIALLERGPSL